MLVERSNLPDIQSSDQSGGRRVRGTQLLIPEPHEDVQPQRPVLQLATNEPTDLAVQEVTTKARGSFRPKFAAKQGEGLREDQIGRGEYERPMIFDQFPGTRVERIGRIYQGEPDACVDVKRLRHLSSVEMVVVVFGDPCSAPSPNSGPTLQQMICASEGFWFAVQLLRGHNGNFDLLTCLGMKFLRHREVAIGEDSRFISERRHKNSLRSA